MHFPCICLLQDTNALKAARLEAFPFILLAAGNLVHRGRLWVALCRQISPHFSLAALCRLTPLWQTDTTWTAPLCQAAFAVV